MFYNIFHNFVAFLFAGLQIRLYICNIIIHTNIYNHDTDQQIQPNNRNTD